MDPILALPAFGLIFTGIMVSALFNETKGEATLYAFWFLKQYDQ